MEEPRDVSVDESVRLVMVAEEEVELVDVAAD